MINKYIDLHLHLDGAITSDIAKKLMELQGLPQKSDEDLNSLLVCPPDCASLNDFLRCFDFPLSLLQTAEALSEAVRLVCENIKTGGLVYAELRFAPQLHRQGGLSQEAVIQAALEGLKNTSLEANLILCCMRGSGNEEENLETVELARKYLTETGGVVALDLAGAEGIYPTKNFAPLFERARKYDIPFTIHAGEADGAESLRAAIDFGARRIGHGVRAVESPDLVKEIGEKNIFLEVCPTSNFMTKAVADKKDFPLRYFLDEGLRLTLNTDDMAIENTTLAEEFRLMEELFDLTEEEEVKLLSNSIDAAFTTEEVKNMLRKMIFA